MLRIEQSLPMIVKDLRELTFQLKVTYKVRVRRKWRKIVRPILPGETRVSGEMYGNNFTCSDYEGQNKYRQRYNRELQ